MNDTMSAPRLATLLLRVFASEPDIPQIEGDLSEEFNKRLLASGPTRARRWYWREVFRNLGALSKRPSTIQVFALAALSVLVFKFSAGFFFQWLQLRLYSEPRVPGLRLLLTGIFEPTIALVLGALMSRFVKAREPMLRLAFTLFFLLFLIRNHLLVGLFDIRTLLYSVNSASVLIAFWMGSVWISRREFRNLPS